MAVGPTHRVQTVSLTILAVVLVAIAAGLAGLVALSIGAAGATGDAEARRLFIWMAGLSVALLGLTLVVLFWTAARWVRSRLRRPGTHGPTPYVDAWALAGKRFTLPEEEAEDDGEDEGDEQQGQAGDDSDADGPA